MQGEKKLVDVMCQIDHIGKITGLWWETESIFQNSTALVAMDEAGNTVRIPLSEYKGILYPLDCALIKILVCVIRAQLCETSEIPNGEPVEMVWDCQYKIAEVLHQKFENIIHPDAVMLQNVKVNGE